MYARTVTNYLLHLLKGGGLTLDLADELTRGPLVTHQGEIVHEVVKAAMAAPRWGWHTTYEPEALATGCLT